jgi:O-antigen ligase
VKFRSIQLWTTIVALLGAPLFFGSVDLFWISVWTVLLSVSVMCGVTAPMGIQQRQLLYAFLAVCGIYLLVALIQIAPNFIGRLNDPVWARANELLGLDVSPRISSRADISQLAAGHFILFVTSFISGFSIGTSRRDGDKLIWFAQHSILLYALYGLIALVITPNLVLWAPKVAYQGSLTATFINHNTAATFLGAGAILWFCMAFSTIRSFDFSSLRLLLLTPTNEDLAFKVIARSIGALVCFFALLLTRSRGGLICSCAGLLVAITLMAADGQQKFWRIALWGSVALAVTAGLLSRIGRIGSQGLFDDGRWSVYAFCLEALRQRPLLGSGIGTFADLFPSLRSNDFYSWGVWDYAHSTILEIAVEMGIPVATLVVIAALGSLYILIGATIKSTGRRRRALAVITGIAVLTYLHSMIDFSLQIPGYLVVFGILVGCGLARACAPEEHSHQPIGVQQSTQNDRSNAADTSVRHPETGGTSSPAITEG